VKIPDFERLSPDSLNRTEWTEIPSDTSKTFSSLVGVPIYGVPKKGNTSFTIETSYYSIACSNVTVGPPIEFWIIDQDMAIDGSPIYNGSFNETHTYFGLDSTASFSVAAAGFQTLNWLQRWDQEVSSRFSKALKSSKHTLNEPQPLLIQSTLYGSSIHYVLNNRREWFPNTTVSAFCNAQTHYMTVNISCTPSYCAATSMRPSQFPHPNPNITDLGHIRAFYEFTSAFVIAGRNDHAVVNGDLTDGNTLTEYYLQDPDFASASQNGPEGLHWGHYGPYRKGPPLLLPTPEEFAARLQQAINGFRMLQMGGPWYMTYPTLNNSMVTTGDNVVLEEIFTVDVWRLVLLILVASVMVGFAIVEMF
jgi:hypothetical protein